MDIIELNKKNLVRHPWELARFEILYDLIKKKLPVSGEEKVIVDIGCGDCFFAEQILQRRKDVVVVGIDTAFTNEEIEKIKQEKSDVKLQLFANLKDAEVFLKDKKANAVLLLDVIEHVKDDLLFLKNISQLNFINKDTNFLISVPAYQILFTQHDVFLKHHRRYTKNSLLKTTANAGLISKNSGYFFSSLLPIRLIEKILEKVGRNKKQKGIGEWKKNKFLTASIKKYLLFEFKLIKTLGKAGIKFPGLSVYCLCQKSA